MQTAEVSGATDARSSSARKPVTARQAVGGTSLLVFDFRKFRVDNLLVTFLGAARVTPLLAAGALRLRLRLGIHGLAQFLRGGHQRLCLRFQGVLARVVLLEKLFSVLQ